MSKNSFVTVPQIYPKISLNTHKHTYYMRTRIHTNIHTGLSLNAIVSLILHGSVVTTIPGSHIPLDELPTHLISSFVCVSKVNKTAS